MRSGIMYGMASMIDGMIDRMTEELGHESTLVATGGVSPLIIPLCKHDILINENLLLQGLNVIYKRNK